MTTFTQTGRPMQFSTPLGPDALLLEGLRGTEAVSALFHFRLDLLADAHKYGRIKVQFFWDRQAQSELKGRNGQAVIPLQYWKTGGTGGGPTCSCWVRVAQTWAGRGWGGLFLPRIGQEVLIGFENGDPDKPVCLGCLYNEANMPPFKLPDEANFSGLKSSSVGGKEANFSGLAVQDALGQEFVQLHSERDLTITAEHRGRHRRRRCGGRGPAGDALVRGTAPARPEADDAARCGPAGPGPEEVAAEGDSP